MSNTNNPSDLHMQAAVDHEEAAKHHQKASESHHHNKLDDAKGSAKSAMDCSDKAKKSSDNACASSIK
ncbi:hypothetical protein [Solimicrobium silvestre]|uniref:Uncharacterized protein n=1 Tax=Solimicrobium silvestre TaxID=2099400 RepID=A0A2S9GUN2_9BURK|nr:hypothetical protein [Solimicrobium silvestre]PRC91408.1 hypothetical protein S2091_3823 [Solimicrobium silvestre]